MVHCVLRSALAPTVLLAAALLSAPAQEAAPSGRAYLGLSGEMTPAQAGATGVVVRQVDPDSPAAQAGLQKGDIITKVAGHKVTGFEMLADTVSQHKPGDKLTFAVVHEGKEKDIAITLGSRPEQRFLRGRGVPQGILLGVQTQPLTEELKQHLGVKADKGALVSEVVAVSPAAKAGVHEKDVIVAVDGHAVANPRDLFEAIQKAGAGKEVALKVERGKETKDIKARLEQTAALPGERPFIERLGGTPGELFEAPARVRALEQKVQDLEKRLHDLEQKTGPAKK
jgi:S1-C subfamily serine protease